MKGFIVTWDADSRDASLCARLKRFVFGYETRKQGRVYRYPGFVERDGVRYLGQSVIFATRASLSALESFLASNGIDYLVTVAGIGPILPNRAERRVRTYGVAQPVSAAEAT
jgi:hypothetical protein